MNTISKLRLLRLTKGKHLYEVAMQAGLTPIRLSLIERGIVKARPDEMKRIVAALGIDTEEWEGIE